VFKSDPHRLSRCVVADPVVDHRPNDHPGVDGDGDLPFGVDAVLPAHDRRLGGNHFRQRRCDQGDRRRLDAQKENLRWGRRELLDAADDRRQSRAGYSLAPRSHECDSASRDGFAELLVDLTDCHRVPTGGEGSSNDRSDGAGADNGDVSHGAPPRRRGASPPSRGFLPRPRPDRCA
jgi:hypothetical protein